MFVCVDGNFVGEKVSDQVPSPLSVASPRSLPEPESRSPKIHTSTTSIALGPNVGSLALPVIVNEALPLALTFCDSVGALTLPVGAPPGAVPALGAGAAAPVPPPFTLTDLNHQPLPPVCM